MNKTNSEAVKEFTEGYNGKPCPEKPISLNYDSVMFIIRMVMSEMDELAATVTNNKEEKDQFMEQALESRDPCNKYDYGEEGSIEHIAAQADSMVDAWYYMLNIASKHGMNLDKLFNVIHEANMNKRDPTTKQFIRRESDGKVIKPEGWESPNIEGEIQKQLDQGSWN